MQENRQQDIAPHILIYRVVKSAMQDGMAKRLWALKWIGDDEGFLPNFLMGWSGSKNTLFQIKLQFASKAEAVAYVERNNLSYTILELPQETQAKDVEPSSYAANYSASRCEPWTH